jgi:hypothetical protein
MSTDQRGAEPIEKPRSWLWDHIGRLTGIVLAVIFMAFLCLLWVAGFPPAGGLLVFLIAVFVMIAVGGRIHRL